ncbi:hypothetical protein [Ectothiorhodospira marina]|uniref:Uncharacterized protein n=1 Tax=Ectothiorhodospira marina TaxID=1396821 RepID=A0A1H7R5H5_9GAMM|nr:hypothetical protein [Ectothiorhodospira marina]SEL55248.1 hypothetical protein SAMN05444515_12060 [Ectothiorhodospira marina]
MNRVMDEKVSALFYRAIEEIALDEKSGSYQSLKSIIGVATGLHNLKVAIISCHKENNIYSSNVLFRSLIEHYAKFLILMYRYSSENNNDVGKDNLIFARAHELKSYGNALKLYKDLVGKDSSMVRYKKAIEKLSDEAASKTSAELKDAFDQFGYRNVAKYFEANENYFFKNKLEVFAPMMLEYSELSTFVHAGPEANDSGADISDAYVNRQLENAFGLAAAVYSMTLLALSRKHPETFDIHRKIDEIVNSQT